MSTALARVKNLPAPLATATAFVDRMREIQDRAFVLCPFAGVDAIREGYQVSERIVAINTDPKAKEVYFSSAFCKGDEVALTKIAILKLWSAAGGSVDESRRVDDRTIPRYCEWNVVMSIKQPDGNIQRYHGSKTLDLRDESDQIKLGNDKTLPAGQLATMRARITELAETEAILRAVRGVLSLRQTYSAAELQAKPFVTYALVPHFDMSDPETKRAVLSDQLGRPLYGEPRALGMGEAAAVDVEVMPPANMDRATGESIEEDDIPPLVEDPPPAAPTEVFQCGCPCGCGADITKTIHERTFEAYGAPRCLQCCPGRQYVYERHKMLTTLGLPKKPGMTPHQANQMVNAKAAGGGGR